MCKIFPVYTDSLTVIFEISQTFILNNIFVSGKFHQFIKGFKRGIYKT